MMTPMPTMMLRKEMNKLLRMVSMGGKRNTKDKLRSEKNNFLIYVYIQMQPKSVTPG